ncbi:MAG: hypothetical protein WC962_06420, partial [Phycisphaerae bacterium]
RANRKCLLAQLDHDVQQRDKKRKMDMRKEIYLKAAEAMTANQMIISSSSNLEISDYELSQKLSESSVILSKVCLIGSEKTVKAVSELSNEMTNQFLRLAIKRIPLVKRKMEIDGLSKQIEHFTKEQSQAFELMKDYNLRENTDEWARNIINIRIESSKKFLDKAISKRDALSNQNVKELMIYSKLSFEALKEISKYSAPVLIAIREEMDLPFSEERYKEILHASLDKTGKTLNEFIADFNAKISEKLN